MNHTREIALNKSGYKKTDGRRVYGKKWVCALNDDVRVFTVALIDAGSSRGHCASLCATYCIDAAEQCGIETTVYITSVFIVTVRRGVTM